LIISNSRSGGAPRKRPRARNVVVKIGAIIG